MIAPIIYQCGRNYLIKKVSKPSMGCEPRHSCYNYSYSNGDFLQDDFAKDNEACFPYLSRERYWYHGATEYKVEDKNPRVELIVKIRLLESLLVIHPPRGDAMICPK
jgi:hypothetical protein